MSRVITQELLNALRRPNPNVYFRLEVSTPDSSQVLRRAVDQWLTMSNPLVSESPASSLTTDYTGALTLMSTNTTLANFPGTQSSTDNAGQMGPPQNTTRLKAMGWQVDPSFDRSVIRSFSAVCKRTVASGAGFLMSQLQLQIYRVQVVPGALQVGPSNPVPFATYNFVPLLNPAPSFSVLDQINAGFPQTVANVTATWDLSSYQIIVDGAACPPVIPGQAGTYPIYYFVVSAIDFGVNTDHHEWYIDTGTSQTVAGVGTFKRRWWVRGSNQLDSKWVELIQGDTYNFNLKVESYSATSTAVYEIDMPTLAPTTSTVRTVIDSSVPPNSSLTVSYSKTASTGPWTACQNGDVISGPPQLKYWMQVVLNSLGQHRTSPQLRALGVECRTSVDLSYEAKPAFTAKALDLPFLKSSIGQLKLPMLRTGARDYSDQLTNLVSKGTGVTSLEADLYLASSHPAVPRSKWLLLERQSVVDRVPDPIGETFICNSYLQKYKKQIPTKVESISTTNIVRAGSSPNQTTPFQVQVDASTPLVGLPYATKGYYIRVKSSGAIPVGYTQVIDGSNTAAGGGLMTFGNALPGVLADGDLVEVHSGIYSATPMQWNNVDPSTVWLQLLTTYLGIPNNRIGLAGIGPFNGYPPTVAQRAPGDATTQAKLTVTNYFDKQQDASQLVEQISFILGGATVEIAGQICFVTIYPTTSPTAAITVPLPASKITLDPRDYFGLNITTSLQKRICLCSCDYGVDYTANPSSNTPVNTTVYVDADALNLLAQQDIEEFGNGQIPSETAKWCFNTTDQGQYLASLLARQVVLANSTGQHVFDFQTVDQYPEITLGDTINLVTDQYVDYDPAYQVPIAGWQSYNLVIVSVDQGGKKFKGILLGLAGMGQRIKNNQVTGGGTGGNTQALVCPSISVTTEFENQGGIVSLQALVTFTPPTSPYYDHMEVTVQPFGGTAGTHVLGATSPGRVTIHAGTSYTFTPIVVTKAGIRTVGSPVTVNPSAQGVVTTTISIGKTTSEIHSVFGSYTSTANPGTTNTNYSTWTGTNPSVAGPVGITFNWFTSSQQAVITLTTNPIAASGIYTLEYDMASSGAGAGQVKALVEYNINGAGWNTYGYIGPQTAPYSVTNANYTINLSGLLAGATSVAFRLTAMAYLTGSSTITNTVTGVQVSWAYTTAGTTFNRTGVQHLQGTASTPHFAMVPTATPPTKTQAAAGEMTMALPNASMAVLQIHDGNDVAQFNRYQVSSSTANSTVTGTTSLTNVAGGTLAPITLNAGETWLIECCGFGQISGGGASFQLGVGFTGTFSSGNYEIVYSNPVAATWNGGAATVLPGLVVSTTGLWFRLRICAVVGTGGSLTLSHAPTLAAQTSTLNQGASIFAIRLS